MGDESPLLRLCLELTLGSLTLKAELATSATSIAVVGASGAGKSTLLRVLAGLERRASGTVFFKEETWQDSARRTFLPSWRRGGGWVPQDSCLFPHLSIGQNLAYGGASPGEIRDLARRFEIDSLLERMPRHLSGGEKQRVALGRALLANPRLLLLDEPFAALDGSLRMKLGQELHSLCRERKLPRVMVSHHQGDVSALAEEVWTVREGTVERVG